MINSFTAWPWRSRQEAWPDSVIRVLASSRRNWDAGTHLLSYWSVLWGSWEDTIVILGKIYLSKRQISVTAHKNIYDPELKIKSWELLPRGRVPPLIPLLFLTCRTNMESHHTERVTQNLRSVTGERRGGCHCAFFVVVVTVIKMWTIASPLKYIWRNCRIKMATHTHTQAPRALRVGRGEAGPAHRLVGLQFDYRYFGCVFWSARVSADDNSPRALRVYFFGISLIYSLVVSFREFIRANKYSYIFFICLFDEESLFERKERI